jgi:hypothetical protein
MTTLNESINARIAKLEADAADIRSKAEADVSAVQSQIDEAKQHLVGLIPYLEHEVIAAKDAVLSFFGKLGI